MHFTDTLDTSLMKLSPQVEEKQENPVVQDISFTYQIPGYAFIKSYIDLNKPFLLLEKGLMSDLNVLAKQEQVLALADLNKVPDLNVLFSGINKILNQGGLFVGSIETFTLRKQRIMKSVPFPVNRMYYGFDNVFNRMFPKLKMTRNFYYKIKNNSYVYSKTEVLGRLCFCGFEIVSEGYIDNRLCFVVRKIKDPINIKNPYYGPLISLKRVGKDGHIFNVYKLRTMHAYSEYLQQYVFEKNNLQSGGKFHNDFRISPEGKFFRKFWLDELPMLINFLKGDMKLVGVRPLSQQYYNLYSEELKQKRIQCKPGLIPPFYADMPETLEEIMASEMKYLEQYQKQPFRTDCRYFMIALKNILFKGARSK